MPVTIQQIIDAVTAFGSAADTETQAAATDRERMQAVQVAEAARRQSSDALTAAHQGTEAARQDAIALITQFTTQPDSPQRVINQYRNKLDRMEGEVTASYAVPAAGKARALFDGHIIMGILHRLGQMGPAAIPILEGLAASLSPPWNTVALQILEGMKAKRPIEGQTTG